MLCGIAGYTVNSEQVRPKTVREHDGTFTDLLAFRGVIEKDGSQT
jgi:hypothetical protein